MAGVLLDLKFPSSSDWLIRLDTLPRSLELVECGILLSVVGMTVWRTRSAVMQNTQTDTNFKVK